MSGNMMNLLQTESQYYGFAADNQLEGHGIFDIMAGGNTDNAPLGIADDLRLIDGSAKSRDNIIKVAICCGQDMIPDE